VRLASCDRTGGSWNRPDLDGYRLEKVVVIDVSPSSDTR